MKTLTLGENLIIDGLDHRVQSDAPCGFFLRCSKGNSAIFSKHGISKLPLQKEVLGYSDSNEGTFPYCKTLEDLTKFVDAIIRFIGDTKDKAKAPAKSLEVHDSVIFNVFVSPGNHVRLEYAVHKTSQGFYLSGIGIENSKVFDLIEVDRFELQNLILGYRDDGDSGFPFCKTLEDLAKFIDVIKARCELSPESRPSRKTEPIIDVSMQPTKSMVDKYMLETNELKLGAKVSLSGIEYVVDKTYKYFLNSPGQKNGQIFDIIGVDDKYVFQKEVLGYTHDSGDFPYCNTLGDLTKLVAAIEKRIVPIKQATPKTGMKESYIVDLSPEPIKRNDKLNTFMFLNL